MHSIEIFIDGPNLHATTKELGFNIDFKKLLEYYRRDNVRIIRAYYFTAIDESEEFSLLRPLLDWLTYNGFTVVTKPSKVYRDPERGRRLKGDIDVDLAVEAMEQAFVGQVQEMIFFTGDGDFRPLIEKIKKRGIRTTVVSTIRSTPPMVADALRREADEFVELETLRTHIAAGEKSQST